MKELRYPDSLGLLYSAFTYYTGFKVNSGEYKVMGLAPYGEPKFVAAIKDKLLEIGDDGSLRMNHEYFSYSQGLRMTNRAFDKLIGGPPRKPESRITQREMDLARSIQVITEEVILKMANIRTAGDQMKYLCLAGGVALNCVANGRVLREVPFEEIWIQPAAGDAGGSLGIALAIWHRYLDQPRQSAEQTGTWKPARSSIANGLAPYADGMKGSFLGPRDSDKANRRLLNFKRGEIPEIHRDELPEAIADLLAQGKVIGLSSGSHGVWSTITWSTQHYWRRSFSEMQSVMNLKIKYRESFRPFAPSVLRERVSDWFELDTDSPYMLLVADVVAHKRRSLTDEDKALWGIEKLNVKRSEIPAVTHVDYSARIQTVRKRDQPVVLGNTRSLRT